MQPSKWASILQGNLEARDGHKTCVLNYFYLAWKISFFITVYYIFHLKINVFKYSYYDANKYHTICDDCTAMSLQYVRRQMTIRGQQYCPVTYTMTREPEPCYTILKQHCWVPTLIPSIVPTYTASCSAPVFSTNDTFLCMQSLICTTKIVQY